MLERTAFSPSPLAGEGGARAAGVGGRGERSRHQLLLDRAKWMRSNPTESERRLWSILRAKRFAGYKFKRQQVLEPYIVDYVCFETRTIVEADGSQHAENAYDLARDARLEGEGFNVVRYWNNQILTDAETVANAIWHALHKPHPPLPPTASRRAPPSPAGGEGFLNGVSHG